MRESFLYACSTEDYYEYFTKPLPKAIVQPTQNVPGTRLITSKQKCESSPLRKNFEEMQRGDGIASKGPSCFLELFHTQRHQTIGSGGNPTVHPRKKSSHIAVLANANTLVQGLSNGSCVACVFQLNLWVRLLNQSMSYRCILMIGMGNSDVAIFTLPPLGMDTVFLPSNVAMTSVRALWGTFNSI